jgi:hypothetical protein
MVLQITGRITLGRDCQQLEWKVEDLVQEKKAKIVLDLAGVDHVDSGNRNGFGPALQLYVATSGGRGMSRPTMSQHVTSTRHHCRQSCGAWSVCPRGGDFEDCPTAVRRAVGPALGGCPVEVAVVGSDQSGPRLEAVSAIRTGAENYRAWLECPRG